MKPRIKKIVYGGSMCYVCDGRDILGYGDTQEDAYNEWVNKRVLKQFIEGVRERRDSSGEQEQKSDNGFINKCRKLWCEIEHRA